MRRLNNRNKKMCQTYGKGSLMRKFSIFTISILIASPIAVTHANAATPKLGGTCSKVGIFGDTPKERFICVKSGKKLVWQKWDKSSPTNNSANKGDATPTPAPSTAPTNVQIAGSSCTTAGAWKNVCLLYTSPSPRDS